MESSSWKSKEMVRLIMSVILLVIGLIMLAAPMVAMEIIVMIIGIVLLVYGVVQLLINIPRRNNGDSNAGIAMPVVAIIIGILLIVFRGGFANTILPFVIGIWAIVTGFMTMAEASEVKHYNAGAWKAALITGIVQFVVGIILIVGVFTATGILGTLLGVCLTIYGILSIVEWGIIASAKKKQ